MTTNVAHSYTNNRLFNSTAICYYKITADLSSLPANVTKTAVMNVFVNRYNNVFIHLNNGTTRKNAEDAIQVQPLNTGNIFNYTAINNTIYMVFVGNEANASVNVSLRLLYVPNPIYVYIDGDDNSTGNATNGNATGSGNIVTVIIN